MADRIEREIEEILSKLDGLLPRHTDNAVIVAGTKA